MGGGEEESRPPEATAAVEEVKKFASTGYVRSSLRVYDGGQSAGARVEAADGGSAVASTAELTASESVIQETHHAAAEATGTAGTSLVMERMREARMKGFEGDPCGDCGNFTLVRNGTCMKCATCGATSGCS
jgi:ribonucleoside-diphosphate reductase alpha chain